MTAPADDVDPGLAAYARALPKAELHVHLEGTIEPDLLLALARRNDVALPWRTAEAVRAAYAFTDLQSFLDLYYAGTAVLVGEQDFYDLTRDYLRTAHAEGVVRVEAYLGPQSFTDRGIALDVVLGGVLRAFDEAAVQDGLSCGLILSTQRHRSEADAFAQLDRLAPWLPRITAFGLGGAERGHPPEKFTRFFAEVDRLGFPITVHAGEEGPAAYVATALDLLGARRIDHGLRCLDDPALVDRLVAERTPLTVCPVSNVALRVTPTLAAHPVPSMIELGLNVSVHSDDPGYFGASLLDTWLRCAATFGWDADVLTGLARASITGSFLDRDEQAALLGPGPKP